MVKSNKLIALLIFLTLTVVALFTLSSCDTDSISSSRGIEYRLTKDGASYDVVGTKFWANGDLVIPSTYKGLPVTGILYINSKKIKSVTIPSSVTNIDKHTFVSNKSLICINVDDENQYYKSIDGNLYTKDGETLVRYAMGKSDTYFEIPNGVKYINVNAFSNCINIEKVIIPNSVTEIGSLAFLACLNLKSVTIGDGVTYIGFVAFQSCHSLTEIVIPDSVRIIGSDAFNSCDSLTSVTIGNSVTNIEKYAFYNCDSLTSITVDESNTKYKSINGNLYTKDGKTLIQYAIGKTDTKFEIPDSVTSIDDGAFDSCDSLTEIVIPDSVTSIGRDAFRDCYSLTIYCEATSKPSGWSSIWNYSGCPVVWGHVHSYTDGECVCGMKQN